MGLRFMSWGIRERVINLSSIQFRFNLCNPKWIRWYSLVTSISERISDIIYEGNYFYIGTVNIFEFFILLSTCKPSEKLYAEVYFKGIFISPVLSIYPHRTDQSNSSTLDDTRAKPSEKCSASTNESVTISMLLALLIKRIFSVVNSLTVAIL